MIYGYARCSTNENMQDITRQFRELEKLGVSKENIFAEYESGMKTDRVQLNKLLNVVSNEDTIIATEASRISRSIKQLLEVLEFAKDKKIKLILGSFVVDFTNSIPDPMTLATVQLMAVFSELERNIISERVKSGMENARAKGKRIGRPKTTVNDIPMVFYKYYPMFSSGKINVSEFARLCGMTRATIYKYLDIVENQEKT